MPKNLVISLPINTRISLFPFSTVNGLKSIGLKYPIDGITFSPFGFLGVSNKTTKEQVKIKIDSQKMLVILPRACLRAILKHVF